LSSPFDLQFPEGHEEENKDDLLENKKKLRRGTSMNVLLDVIKKNQSSLKNFGALDFNIFDFAKKVERE